MMAIPLAAPFIDVLIVRGGLRWLGAYGLIVAMGAAAAALAVASRWRCSASSGPGARGLWRRSSPR